LLGGTSNIEIKIFMWAGQKNWADAC